MNNIRHIVLDLETLSPVPGACIVAIGAQVYDGEIDTFGDAFYQVVELASCDRSDIDPDTVIWWMKQSDAARQVFSSADRVGIYEALRLFARFVETQRAGGRPIRVWGNGATFDNVILSEAYRVYDALRLRPWTYREDACLRTLCSLFPHIERVKPDLAHHALSDARAQAGTLRKLLHLIGGANQQPANYLTPEST